jgi:hypothetical protein
MTGINVINSTFYDNRAPAGTFGGAINGDGAVITITNSTFLSNSAAAFNGGAFSQNYHLHVHNVLIAFNIGGNCEFTMTLSSANANLEYPAATCGGANVQADPRALAPADNGGPTLTSALLPNSPAINAGDDAGCPGVDQRGAPRPVAAHCDTPAPLDPALAGSGQVRVGAFEFGGKVPRLWLPLVRK